MKKKYDLGMVGWWNNLNYGGTLTYYALHQVIRSLGYSVLMIRRASNNPRISDSVPERFSQKHYQISDVYPRDRMGQLNDLCDGFIVGSDQIWNPHLMTWSGPEYFLSFCSAEKKRIAYGTSFGNIEHCNASFIADYKKWLQAFDAISVREDYAVNILKEDFGIDGLQVCDPVFLAEKSSFESIANDATEQYPSKFQLNFILDPNKEKTDAIRYVGEKLKISNRVNFTDLQKIEEHVKGFQGEYVYSNSDIENLIKAYRDAEFVVTDSFHGTCLAIIFNKPFISIANHERGAKRFVSMLTFTNLMHRLAWSVDDIYNQPELLEPVDFKQANAIILQARERDRAWLKQAIETPRSHKKEQETAQWMTTQTKEKSTTVNLQNPVTPEVQQLYNNPDFIKIRMIVTLLRDYGIKHVVLSPGGRDVPLVRMFEYNAEFFHLHCVTDERSAAYFGMGIAAQLRQPVVCVCTSGTAVSNYLPAVTESYYTGVPLILLTADRREVYHEHGEDQTIPQNQVFHGVVKKEITIPEASNPLALHQVRRDVSDCILESTHNGFGPVHINIAIDNISIGARVPKEHWRLLPPMHPLILRVSSNDEEKQIDKWVQTLKKSPRVLLVYGQNAPQNAKQLENISRFAKQFNCVIATDFLSNLHCEYTIKPFNMLNQISQQEFDEKLTPDIVVSVGGKQLMNDPLTGKIRHGRSYIRHWSVLPSGKVKDFYFHLTSVLEMSQDYFFHYFSEHSTDSINDGRYYQQWEKLLNQYHAPAIKRFDAHYIQSKFIPAVPSDSILHLGVGQSFYDSRRYNINPTVEIFCNMGTNGIDGCTSTFLGQCSVIKDRLCFLLVGDLSFFYDMNSIWNKNLHKNIRILMVNNNGTDLLRGHNLKAISSVHNTKAQGWVESTEFTYLSAHSQEEFDQKLPYFLSEESDSPLFFEVFY